MTVQEIKDGAYFAGLIDQKLNNDEFVKYIYEHINEAVNSCRYKSSFDIIFDDEEILDGIVVVRHQTDNNEDASIIDISREHPEYSSSENDSDEKYRLLAYSVIIDNLTQYIHYFHRKNICIQFEFIKFNRKYDSRIYESMNAIVMYSPNEINGLKVTIQID